MQDLLALDHAAESYGYHPAVTGALGRAFRRLQPAPAGGDVLRRRAAVHRQPRRRPRRARRRRRLRSAASPRRRRPQQQLWLGLGFAYMMVITGICLVVQADVVRYRPLLLVLAVGKAASSLATRSAPSSSTTTSSPTCELRRRRLPRAASRSALVARRPGRRPRRPLLKARPGAQSRRAEGPAGLRRGHGAGRRRAAARGGNDPGPDDVDVAGPLNRYLATMPPRQVLLARTGAARLRPAAVPLALQPRQPRRRARTSCASMEEAERPLLGELLLFLKVLAGLGYGNDASRARRDRLRDHAARSTATPPPARRPRRPRRARADRGRRGMRRRHRRLGRRRRRRGDGAGGGRARRGRARGRALHGPGLLPGGAARGAGRALPRRRADDRPGPSRDPDPGGPRGRRHDGDQLGHLLSRARGRARRVAGRARDRVGDRARPRLRAGRGDARTSRRSTPRRWAATARSCARRPTRWA